MKKEKKKAYAKNLTTDIYIYTTTKNRFVAIGCRIGYKMVTNTPIPIVGFMTILYRATLYATTRFFPVVACNSTHKNAFM